MKDQRTSYGTGKSFFGTTQGCSQWSGQSGHGRTGLGLITKQHIGLEVVINV